MRAIERAYVPSYPNRMSNWHSLRMCVCVGSIICYVGGARGKRMIFIVRPMNCRCAAVIEIVIYSPRGPRTRTGRGGEAFFISAA